jgi:hypothetical protein
MANVVGPGWCAACGRLLPAQQGRGRRRRFCDATCRSAARRQRAQSQRHQGSAKAPLTSDGAHVGVDVRGTRSTGADPVAERIQRAAERLVTELSHPATGSALEALTAARELSGATDAALRAAVDRARAAGQSWGRIGDVLGTTRQAAFQRFGRPGLPGDPQPEPGLGGAQAS